MNNKKIKKPLLFGLGTICSITSISTIISCADTNKNPNNPGGGDNNNANEDKSTSFSSLNTTNIDSVITLTLNGKNLPLEIEKYQVIIDGKEDNQGWSILPNTTSNKIQFSKIDPFLQKKVVKVQLRNNAEVFALSVVGKNSVEYNYKEYDKVTNDILKTTIYSEKKLGYSSRIANKQFYTTKLETKYPNFKYPGHDINYRKDKNSFLTDDNRISLMTEIMDERTDFVVNENANSDKDKYAKYSDQRFILDEIKNKRLKKHPAVKNFYVNNVADQTKSLTKEFNLNTSNYGESALGLYAPAGEVITITLDKQTFETLKRTKWNGLKVVINQNYWDCKAPTDNGGQIKNRYPYLLTTFDINVKDIDETTRSFKFGTPFGGGISIRFDSRLEKFDANQEEYGPKQYENIKFKIEGAVEQFFYADGSTTKEDWDDQIKRLKNNEITAPTLAANADFFSFQMQFYDTPNEKKLAYGKSLDSLIYPKETFAKWQDFMFLSLYGHRNDETGSFPKCSFRYAEEIWGGAAAWGGGNNFYCPPDWGVNSFFNGPEYLRAANWGSLHEANHNYQINEALFKRRTHGETNQVNIVNLSLLNDQNRWRNPLNLFEEDKYDSPGGSIYVNSYSIIHHVNRKYEQGIKNGKTEAEIHSSTEEYPIYAMLVHKLGTYNYLDYIRWDQVYHPWNTTPNWNGLEEIRALSDFFGINFYEAFADYGKNWNESKTDKDWNKDLSWPKSYQEANEEQKQVIKRLRDEYLAFDFVGNFYASGSYLYNAKTNKFDYTGDVTSTFEIPAGQPYVFEFDQFINSPNLNFRWDNLTIESQSKTGATISIDPTNSKRIIYTPNVQKLDEVDEFDISIKSTNNPQNVKYVPKYMWKIKVRQNAKGPLISYYDPFEVRKNKQYNTLFNEEWPRIEQQKPKYTWISNGKTEVNALNYYDVKNTKWVQPIKYEMNFIAPQTGTYVFKGKWDDVCELHINGQKVVVPNQAGYQPELREMFERNLNSGEVINIKFVVINTGGKGFVDFVGYIKENNELKEINVYENSIVPYFNDVLSSFYTINDILNNEKYQYKRRRLDYSKIKNSNEFNNQYSVITKAEISEDEYTISYNKSNGVLSGDNSVATDFKHINKMLKFNRENDENHVEYWKWGSSNNNKPEPLPEDLFFEFDVNLKEPTFMKAIMFYNTRKGWSSTYASRLQVVGFTSDDPSEQGEVILDSPYGSRGLKFSKFDFNKSGTWKKLKIKMFTSKNLTYKAVTFGSFKLLRNSKEDFEVGKTYGMQYANIKKSSQWNIEQSNEDINVSNIANNYAISKSLNSAIEFEVKNSRGFRIIGQKTIEEANFEVYIDGKLIDIVSTISNLNRKKFNETIYQYWNEEKRTFKVKIIHKNKNPLFINGISLFGIDAKI